MTVRSPARAAVMGTASLVVGALLLVPAAPAVATAEPRPPKPMAADSPLLDREGTQVRPRRGAPELPGGVSALSWLVADADTGEVLAARDAHRQLPPASTLKALFALTALPNVPGELRHRVTEEELAGVGDGSSLVGIIPGRTYRAADLWRGVFLSSGNDAVHVLAEMNGGWKHTAARMTAKAKELGARNTRVVSPDGYDAPGQVSSAYDLAVFGRAGLREEEFVEYSGTAVAKFPGDGWSYDIQNTNRLLTGADGVGTYPGIIGVKNGYTSRAGHTLIAAARREDRTLVVSVMNPQAGGGRAVYAEARALLDWGFAAAGRVSPVGSLEPPPAPAPKAGPEAAARSAAAREEEKGGSGGVWPAVGALAGVLCVAAAVAVPLWRARRGAFGRG
ncbi:D-alanyl-D-alanine carboxypeptidase family protein [Streptomyces apocyni]|uniref:D-alanyl-D-alanine carboxypeptidase family protein n=1 Tax=Streptomyces apocyni TaxID=2654677 RepID=UPI0012EACD76|nr:serine hydrolase [Streptomyces apocyni]